jgi:hypothetical protein
MQVAKGNLQMQEASNRKQWPSPKEAAKEYDIGFSTFASFAFMAEGRLIPSLARKYSIIGRTSKLG